MIDLTYVIALILLGRGFGLLFLRIGIQSILGEVLAGIVLGIVLLSLDMTLVPESLRAFGDLGILTLMLLAGLMTDFRLFSLSKKESTAIGAGGVAISFIMVFIPMLWINTNVLDLGPTVGFASALFVAAVLSNTAIEVCAKLLMDDGEHDRVKTTIIGASFVDDIIAVFLIGVVSSAVFLGHTPSITELVWLAAKVVIFLAVCFVLVSYVVKKVFDRFVTTFLKRERMHLSATLIVAFGLALLARPFGLHEVIGAYIAGLVIGKWGAELGPMLKRRLVWEKLVSDLDPPLRAIFSPLFFGYVGLIFVQFIAPIGLSKEVLAISAILFILAVAGKIVGCGGTARLMKFDKGESLEIGTGMVGRGALELVLVLYGMEAGILVRSQFSAVLIVTLGTIVATPVLYAWAHNRRK